MELGVKTLNFSVSEDVRKLILMYSWSGIHTAFAFGMLTPLMVLLQSKTAETASLDDAHMEGNALYSFVYLGIGEVLAGIAFSVFSDKMSNRALLLIQAFLVVLTVSLMELNLYTGKFGTLTNWICFVTGFGDGIYNNYCNKLTISEFSDNAISISVYNMYECLNSFLTFWIQSEIDVYNTESLQRYVLAVGVAGIICTLSPWFHPFGKYRTK